MRSSHAVRGEHTCVCLYQSDLGRVSREYDFCNILLFIVQLKEEGHSEVPF